jgi:predicted Ser/Thr protein kinase
LEQAEPAAPPPEDAAALAQNFPQLVIEELIGVGGMGRVYKARQPHLNRTVALKVLSPARAADPEWLERFTREARALARLSHPHIVQVYDFGEAPVPYLLMEYVEGVNLREAMAAGGLTASEALAIVPKLCDALQYAHEHGVLHRDIKPENILIDSQGRVKVVDFGLAKLREDGGQSFTLTQSGARLGTLAYMAPEQVERPQDVDHRADIYSLGVVFYEMLTGELPLGRFPTPSEASGVDARLDSVVLRTLEKQRDKRFQSAQELRTGIQSAAEGPAPAAKAYVWNQVDFDFRSKAAFRGLPLVHVAFGVDPQTGRQRRARGVVAVGAHATGVVALGVVARGVLSWGVASVGVVSGGVATAGIISGGVASLGLLLSYGVFGVSPYALGVTAIGYMAAGVRAFGVHQADLSGAVDAQAAAFGDAWLNSATRLFLVSNAVALAAIMLCGAWAAWGTHARNGRRDIGWRMAAMYVLLAFIGPVSFLGPSRAASDTPRFSRRLKAAQEPVPPWHASVDIERTEKIAAVAQPLIQQASRTDSVAARDAAIQEIIAAIQSQDEIQILGGLSAAVRVWRIQFDKTGLRLAARPHLDSASAEIRAKAALVVTVSDPEPADRKRILDMIPTATQPEWSALASALGEFSKRDYTGEYAAPMLHLLNRGIEAALRREYDSREVLGPLWGGRFSPEIEAKVVEWSYLQPGPYGVIGSNGIGYQAFYYALSTQANKSAASAKRLLELTQHPDIRNVGGRCLWGLRGTVADPSDQATVAAAVIRLLEQRTDDYLWKQGIALLADYATREHLPAIEALTEREALPIDQRDKLRQITEALRQKS